MVRVTQPHPQGVYGTQKPARMTRLSLPKSILKPSIFQEFSSVLVVHYFSSVADRDQNARVTRIETRP